MSLLVQFLGSIIRYALAAILGGLVLRGVIDTSLADQIVNSWSGQIAGWILGVGVPLLWSAWHKWRSKKAVDTALELPSFSTPADLREAMKGGAK